MLQAPASHKEKGLRKFLSVENRNFVIIDVSSVQIQKPLINWQLQRELLSLSIAIKDDIKTIKEKKKRVKISCVQRKEFKNSARRKNDELQL